MRSLTLLSVGGAATLAAVSAAPGATLLQQDFGAGATVANIQSATPNSSQFHSVAAQGSATAQISGEELVLTAGASGANAGFFRGSMGDGGLMAFTGNFRVNEVSGEYSGPFAHLTFGDYADNSTNATYNHLASLFTEVIFRSSPADFKIEGGSTALGGKWEHRVDFGIDYRLTVLMNNTSANQTYQGLDGQSHQLTVSAATDGQGDAFTRGAYAVWLTDLSNPGSPVHLLVADDKQASNYVHSNNFNDRTLDSILFDLNGKDNGTLAFEWDNLVVGDALPIPEPASLALLGAGLTVMVARRRA